MDRGAWWAIVHGVTKSQEVLINRDNKTHPSIHPFIHPSALGLTPRGPGCRDTVMNKWLCPRGADLGESEVGVHVSEETNERDPDVRGAVESAGGGLEMRRPLRGGGPQASLRWHLELNRRDEDGLGTRCQPRGHRCRVKRRLGSCGAGRKLVGLEHPVRFSLAVVQSLFQEPGERTTGEGEGG